MRIEEVVGAQMKEHRELRGLTQQLLGQELGAYLGRPWSRQAVSAAEKGDRSFTAAELVALAMALNATVADLLKPPLREEAVDLSDACVVPREVLIAVVEPSLSDDVDLDAIKETLAHLADCAARNREEGAQIVKLSQDLDRLITRRDAAYRVVRLPRAPQPFAGGHQ